VSIIAKRHICTFVVAKAQQLRHHDQMYKNSNRNLVIGFLKQKKNIIDGQQNNNFEKIRSKIIG